MRGYENCYLYLLVFTCKSMPFSEAIFLAYGLAMILPMGPCDGVGVIGTVGDGVVVDAGIGDGEGGVGVEGDGAGDPISAGGW